MVKLQPRDLRLLEALSRYGVLSTKQIKNLFFSSIRFTTMMRRLRLLEQSKFLTRGITLTDQNFTWRLGWRGEQRLGIEIPGSFSNRNTIDHDVLVNEVRMRLEKFNLAKSWRPEFEMKAEAFRTERYKQAKDRLIPDGVLHESKEQKSSAIAVEVELTRKSESRYRRIFYQYNDRHDLNHIWYFTRTVGEARAILQMAQKNILFDAKKLWFSELNNFFNSENPKVFSVQAGRWLEFSELGFDQFERIKPAQSLTQGMSTEEVKNLSIEVQANPLNSFSNSQNEMAMLAVPPAPDPSPSTRGRGQEQVAGTENENSELEKELELKKTG